MYCDQFVWLTLVVSRIGVGAILYVLLVLKPKEYLNRIEPSRPVAVLTDQIMIDTRNSLHVYLKALFRTICVSICQNLLYNEKQQIK